MTKIRVATIGSSRIAESFLMGARHDARFCHAAVYSRTLDRGREFAAKHGVEKVYTSLDELAAAPDIDAVYIASPNIFHAPQAIKMMDGGKSVLVEKPAATSAEEFEAMMAAARHNGVSLMEAMRPTLVPNFQAVREALPKIGRIRRYTATYCQYSSRYEEFKRGIVASNLSADMRGGALLDLGVYCIAPMVHLFGAPWEGDFTREKLEKCVQKQETIIYPGSGSASEKGIDGQGSMLIKYPGFEAMISYSKIGDSSLAAEIQGEDGCIVIDRINLMVGPKLVMRVGCGTRGDTGFSGGNGASQSGPVDLSRDTIKDNIYYEVKEFLDLVENRRPESAENSWRSSLIQAQICSR
ncbi:MAG: Gfo/Idh/MocA family oxidoreductase [Bacteroidales bacterium]|nr:Gfo/Idh/MocA family oxidoreductase [Bacteroidales bacterium]